MECQLNRLRKANKLLLLLHSNSQPIFKSFQVNNSRFQPQYRYLILQQFQEASKTSKIINSYQNSQNSNKGNYPIVNSSSFNCLNLGSTLVATTVVKQPADNRLKKMATKNLRMLCKYQIIQTTKMEMLGNKKKNIKGKGMIAQHLSKPSYARSSTFTQHLAIGRI